MRISDWSSDVCSSDLRALRHVTRVRKGNATPCKIKIGRLADLFKASRSDFWQHSGKHVVTVEKLVFQSACDVEAKHRNRRKRQYFMRLAPYTRSASDRKSVVSGKSVSVRVDLGGRRIIKKKKT